MPKSRKPKATHAERKAQAAEVIEKMQRAIAADIVTGADWMEHLRFLKSFRGYSARNAMLLWAQWEERKEVRRVCRAIEVGFFGAPISPELGRLGPCAGFSAWEKRGGKINKGEKGLGVMAPSIIVPDKTDIDPATGKPRTKCIGFFPIYKTFGLAQVSGVDAPPEPVSLLAGESPEGAWEKLVNLAEHIGYTVKVHAISGDENGSCEYLPKIINVKESLAPAQRTKTLVHEIAHALMHSPESSLCRLFMPRAIGEIEAESVAFAVCDFLELDASAYSLGYVGGWAKGNEALIASTMERVVATAARITEFLESGTLPDATGTTKFEFAEDAALAS